MCCTLPLGRRRPQLVDGGDELFVCDLCWRLAGGREAIEARAAGEQPVPLLELDPAAEAVLAAAEYDQLHPLDRLLTQAGVRWAVLRFIVPTARVDLASKVLTRVAPEWTRPAESPYVWLDVVADRIRACTGTEFKRNAKRRRFWRIARVYAVCADRSGRPLTWVTQDDIAAAVGCSTRTVRRCLSWLQQEGLLWELVPGCRLPMMERPEGETPEERDERRQRLAAAIAAEEAARERARVELEHVRKGASGRAARALAQRDAGEIPRIDIPSTSTQPDQEQDAERPLVNLCPVYELRVPLTAAERREADELAQAHRPVLTAGEQLLERFRRHQVHPRNAEVQVEVAGGVFGVTEAGLLRWLGWQDLLPWRSGASLQGIVGMLRTDAVDESPQLTALIEDFVHPPQVSLVDQEKSNYVRGVDNRRAPRGSDKKGLSSIENGPELPAEAKTQGSATDARRKRPSRAQRAAERLLRGLLRPEVSDGVSIRWLTARLRGSKLLDYGWTEQDLADQIHGLLEYRHLPRHIHNSRAWISARLAKATPELPPSKQQAIRAVEVAAADERRAARETAALRERREEIAARRAAIDACDLCDELGWLPVPDGVPVPKCNHDPDTGGW
ncbi:hypothetical protein GCM10010470_67080 [Saccharopolyspora taberi]|uniref:Helix-turn-helix domain-containing protein n=1 Tax=Saccharopolyspora taberi TaxID=60895 RepID=A0ABN3VP96_9PSEU